MSDASPVRSYLMVYRVRKTITAPMVIHWPWNPQSNPIPIKACSENDNVALLIWNDDSKATMLSTMLWCGILHNTVPAHTIQSLSRSNPSPIPTICGYTNFLWQVHHQLKQFSVKIKNKIWVTFLHIIYQIKLHVKYLHICITWWRNIGSWV